MPLNEISSCNTFSVVIKFKGDVFLCEQTSILAKGSLPVSLSIDIKSWVYNAWAILHMKLKEGPKCCPQQANWIKIIRLQDNLAKDREAAPSLEASAPSRAPK